MFAYFDILKAKGGENVSLEGININKIYELSKNLLNKVWKPGIARRVIIPKKPSDELKSFTIVSIFDKIVATAIKTIFTFIFEKHLKFNPLPKEKCFQDASHGFRLNRSCHTALNVIITWGLVP